MLIHRSIDPREVRLELAPLGELLGLALADGCDEGVRYHEQRAFDVINPWVHAPLARQWTLRYLERTGIEGLGFTLEPTTNVGIHLIGEKYQIRVLKIERRRNPGTGLGDRGAPFSRSLARERYFTQPSLEGLLNGDAMALDGMEPLINLVALWETDEAFQLVALDLAYPRGVSSRRSAVDLHWLVPFVGGDVTELLDLDGSLAPPRIPLADLEVYESPLPEEISEAE